MPEQGHGPDKARGLTWADGGAERLRGCSR
jgi:hypothetical protein